MDMIETELRENLSSEMHNIWIHWMTYLQGEVEWREDIGWIIPEDVIIGWQRQMRTPYCELSEREKDSDRSQADRVIALLGGYPNATVDRAAALIWNCAETHRHTCRDRSEWFWFRGLVSEVKELALALLRVHRHPGREWLDVVDWELRQIGSIAMNWIRIRESR